MKCYAQCCNEIKMRAYIIYKEYGFMLLGNNHLFKVKVHTNTLSFFIVINLTSRPMHVT